MSSYDQEEGTDALRGALRVIECLLNQLDKLTLSNAMLKRELQEKTKAAADIPSATQAQLESKNRMIVSATQENAKLKAELEQSMATIRHLNRQLAEVTGRPLNPTDEERKQAVIHWAPSSPLMLTKVPL